MDEIKLTNENVADASSENAIIYAKFGDRLIARIIDILITSLVGYLIISNKLDTVPTVQIPAIILLAGFAVYHILYSPIMESLGGTFGKKIAKIRTINIKTNKAPSIGQTIARTAFIIVPMFVIFFLMTVIEKSMSTSMSLDSQGHISQSTNPSSLAFIVLFIYLIPLLAMLWSPTKQCWHDRFSKIAVIKIVN